MDVLKPQLIHIGNRIYRRNPVTQHGEDPEPYREEEMEDLQGEGTYYDEVCQTGYEEIEETENGYCLRMPIPSVFFKFIIGKKGETKKKLENETCTSIKIPRAGHDGDIVIQGRDKKGVISAKIRIEILVESGRDKIPFTHFLSLPIQCPQVLEKFNEFKAAVLTQCAGDRGIDETIFQKSAKLHLTIGVLTLISRDEIEKAVEVLQRCQNTLVRPILGSSPLDIEVKGLEYMNDDPDNVDVLYAKVEPVDGSRRLTDLVNGLVAEFVDAGLMKQQYDRVKLHLTVMNTIMRKDPSGIIQDGAGSRKHRGYRDRESFDATSVLQHFGEFDFGRMTVDSVHLSDKSRVAPDGYYANDGMLMLPSATQL